MAKKLFGLNKPDTRLRKNVFDLSASNTYSISAGMLVPTLIRELNPGEKVELSVASMIRTQPLNTAAFVRSTQYYHAFFVPFKQLWSPWDNFINGVDYRQSTLQKKAGDSIPGFKFAKLILRLFQAGLLAGVHADKDGTNVISIGDPSKSRDQLGYSYVYGISRLLDMLGYGFEIGIRPKKYLKEFVWVDDVDIRYDYGNIVGGPDVEALANKPRDGHYQSYATNPPGADALLRISSFADLCNLVFRYPKEFLSVPTGSTANKKVDRYSVTKNLEDLIYDCFGGYMFNPFRLLAYQKIYADFYRRQDYEASRPDFYNIDDQIGKELDITDDARLLGIFSLRYRWLAKDYFTGVVPSELFGLGNMSSKLTGLLGKDETINSGAGDGSGSYGISSRINDVTYHNGDGLISTRSVRAMFAIEKLLRLTRRAGDYDYISQTAAHYGVDVPRGRGDEVSFLGGWSSEIDISEVVTTAENKEGVAGNIYGRGVGVVKGKEINYEAKEHGLLMVITSVVPDSDYSAVGMNNFNMKLYRGDYFHPEFQDLGLQPVFSDELAFCPYKEARVQGKDYDRNRNSVVLGFSPRYSEYKTAVDELHGEFRAGKEFSPWVSSIKVFDGSFFGESGIKPSALFISPAQLDSIFARRFDGSESSDQFICVCQSVCKIIRPMSITGQTL